MVACAFTDVSERVIHITEFGDGDQFSNFEVNIYMNFSTVIFEQLRFEQSVQEIIFEE